MNILDNIIKYINFYFIRSKLNKNLIKNYTFIFTVTIISYSCKFQLIIILFFFKIKYITIYKV